MKRLLLITFSFLALFIQNGFAQNMILNAGFEELNNLTYWDPNCAFYDCWRQTSDFCPDRGGYAEANNNPFKQCGNNSEQGVKYWKSACGTPQSTSVDCGYPFRNIVHSGNHGVFMAATSIDVYSEGIYQDNISFAPDAVYNISLWYYADGNGAKIVVKAANNLTESESRGYPNVPSQLIIEEGKAPGQWHKIEINGFSPNGYYNQLLIYPMNSSSQQTTVSIMLDDVFVSKSCCPKYKYYQNTINPTSVNVSDVIVAGNNVTSVPPYGDVIINNNSSVSFEAGNSVTLNQGFVADNVQNFTAQIKNCLARPMEIWVSPPTQLQCSTKLFASACYGSGDYEFIWNDGAGYGQVFEFVPLTNSTIKVFVRDRVSNQTVTQYVNVNASTSFRGSFSMQPIPNVFTPNGDGYNDIWRIADNGKSTYAYNATRYDLQIFDRWGNKIFAKSASTSHPGFNDNEIMWNGYQIQGGKFCDAVAFFTLTLWNCNSSQSFSGNIQSICGGQLQKRDLSDTLLASVNNEDDLLSAAESKSGIIPNPVIERAVLKYYISSQETNPSIKISDVFGRVISSIKIADYAIGYNEYALDFSKYTNGLYFLSIETAHKTEVIKFVVSK